MLVGFVGLSHLGLVSLAAAAAKGYKTIGYDADAELLRKLRTGEFPVYEPGLAEQYREYKDQIILSSSPADLSRADVVYISRDVPTDQENRSQLEVIEQLINQSAQALAPCAVLVVLCQVPPGFMRRTQQKLSAVRPDLHLIYQVETLIFGCALERALFPERIIVGTADGQNLPDVYLELLHSFNCPLFIMRFESAELAKIAINIMLISSLASSNVLASLCEANGAEWSEIVPALKSDRRIGQYAYMTPGLGIAGGNLERDLASLTQMLDFAGVDGALPNVWNNWIHAQPNWVWNCLRQVLAQIELRDNKIKIAVLGIAYKAGTSSIKNSPAVQLIEELSQAGMPFEIKAYDPQVKQLAGAKGNLKVVDSVAQAIEGAQILVIMNESVEFRTLSASRFVAAVGLIDPYAVIKGHENLGPQCQYFTRGSAPVARSLDDDLLLR